MSKRMVFTLLVMDSVGHNFQGGWRHPEARNREFKGLDLWVDLAKKAEQAKIDAFFFTDVLGIQGEFNRSRDIVFEQAVNVPIGDSAMLMPALARETSDIGFLYTSSVISKHPFMFARQVSTLDNLSGGRVGWNIVTSANERAFRNFGLPEQPVPRGALQLGQGIRRRRLQALGRLLGRGCRGQRRHSRRLHRSGQDPRHPPRG